MYRKSVKTTAKHYPTKAKEPKNVTAVQNLFTENSTIETQDSMTQRHNIFNLIQTKNRNSFGQQWYGRSLLYVKQPLS
jgi:hypothetical protein